MTGYDGSYYEIGSRIAVHPDSAEQLGVKSPCLGVVVGIAPTWRDRVRVRLDVWPELTFGGDETTFCKWGA